MNLNNKIESPCLKCELHLSGVSKDNNICKECDKRIDYLIRLAGYSDIIPTGNQTIKDQNNKQSPIKINNQEINEIPCKNCGTKLKHTEDNFFKHPPTGKLTNLCIMCFKKRQANGQIKRYTKHKIKKHVQDVQENKNTMTLLLDFTKYPTEFEKLCKLAKNKIREPENQALYILIKKLQNECKDESYEK